VNKVKQIQYIKRQSSIEADTEHLHAPSATGHTVRTDRQRQRKRDIHKDVNRQTNR